MNIKALGLLTILSLFAASNVMAADFKHNHHSDNKRKNVHVVVKNTHTTKSLITTRHKAQHSTRSIQHKHNNKRSNHLGILIGGIVLGSVLSGH